MDVDPGEPVGMLGHHSREKRNGPDVEFMSDPVRGDGHGGRIAKDDFIQTLCRRVAIVGRPHISSKGLSQAGHLLEEKDCLGLAPVETMCADDLASVALVANRLGDLMGELLKDDIDFTADVIGQIVSIDFLVAKVTGVEQVSEILDQSNNRLLVGNGHRVDMVNAVLILTTLDDPVDDSRKLAPEILGGFNGGMAFIRSGNDTNLLSGWHVAPY